MDIQLPEDFMQRYQEATQDLGTGVGRRAFYGEFDRGVGEMEMALAGGVIRECDPRFTATILADLDALATMVKYFPEQFSHESAVDIAHAIAVEIDRLDANSELFPNYAVRSRFFNAAETKLNIVKDAMNLRIGYHETNEEELQSSSQHEGAHARPSHQIGLAPWSQFLVPGAPAVREAGYRDLERDGYTTQVLPPVAESIIAQWEAEFRDLEARYPVESTRNDEKNEDEDEEIDAYDVALDDDFFSHFGISREQEGPNAAMSLPQVNAMMQRLEAMPHPITNPAQVLAMTEMLGREEEYEDEVEQVSMTVVRRRRRN